jgi:uncharacterized membrane protein
MAPRTVAEAVRIVSPPNIFKIYIKQGEMKMIKTFVAAIGLLMAVGVPGVAEPIQPMKEVFYRVVGVASNDVLNIRAQPTSRSEIIGAFHHNHPLFEVNGRDGRWVRVNLGEYSGWVHSGYIEAVNVPTFLHTNLPNGLKCYGEEPFWTVTLNSGQIQIKSMANQDRTYITSKVESFGNDHLISGVSNSGNEIVIFVEDKMTSSSMVDRFFNWSVSLYLDGLPVSGGAGCSL